MAFKKRGIVKQEQTKIALKFYFSLLVVSLILGYPIYFLIKSGVRSYQLSNNSKTIKGIVIDEKNFTGHSPVNHQFYYSYEFWVDGTRYKGNTGNSKYSIGDSVEIRYSIYNPSFNEVVKMP
ncbi:hypothetical protein [Emticicia sp. C21]|uniref:hypothetical protein n=1 Tax=Emticicia sp. C21 TaxID=2302915 RepID=UPI000E34784B|nr:hypothetical protein [Emticicia sp. C21]RFS15317.1 hypothetical protein D0T08_17495 [Emticicia sp. C21]